MRKLIIWCKDHLLLLATGLLLVFIPLYPKLPIVDVRHTWVYVRAEDFVVLSILALWGYLLIRKRVTLATPLTAPIFLFWLVGLVATVHGILLILPAFGETPGSVSFLSFIRRIEYMSVFFVAYWAVKDKKFLGPILTILTGTVLAVLLYALGQKFLAFPAYLTMNEEFAKGIAITLSSQSRLSATFGGHYDLAAWLVLTLPILASIMFALRSRMGKIVLLGTIALGLVVLFWTVSRVSLFALVIAFGLVLWVQKRKLVLLAIPAAILAGIVLIALSPKVVERFGSTLTTTEVLVDAATGAAIGHTNVVPNTYFADKVVRQAFSRDIKNVYAVATPSAAIVIPYTKMPEEVVLYREPNAPTGEDLPQGTGYVNLTLAPVIAKMENFYFEPTTKTATTSAEVFIINGNFLVKRAYAYDLSFTTRFQGEWPRALAAFAKNIFLGSGYGSVGLAVDNSYLRMLAEVGLVGFGAFLAIFVAAGVVIKLAFPKIESPLARSFLVGLAAGVAGLAVNGLFIDVFEASKVAFTLWILVGIALGVAHLYDRRTVRPLKEYVSIVTSPVAIIVYLLILTVVQYGIMLANAFVADDFTWLRWASEGKVDFATIASYFTTAGGFFFRPGTKLYFLLMYHSLWLNQTMYHVVSLALHFIVGVLVYLLARRILKQGLLAAAAAALFILTAGIAETVVWVSATGHLFAAAFMLTALLAYISWDEKRNAWALGGAFAASLAAMLFHEVGIVTPLLFILYAYTLGSVRKVNWPLITPVPLYLAVRYLAGSHWLSGDYNYNLVKLPFNAVGNALSYLALALMGPSALALMSGLRGLLRGELFVAGAIGLGGVLLLVVVWRFWRRWASGEDRSIFLFALGMFVINLLPFLGLGNASPRYGYLATVGVVILLVWAGEKLYQAFKGSGRTVAMLGIATIAGTFVFYQLVAQQQVRQDWSVASDVSGNFLTSLQAHYTHQWTDGPVEFHFVGVPIRRGEAWVFPVGIPDALWLLFRNPQTKVYTWSTIDGALQAVGYDSVYQYVFEFDENGRLNKHIKTLPTHETE
jgi:hypothetical protein